MKLLEDLKTLIEEHETEQNPILKYEIAIKISKLSCKAEKIRTQAFKRMVKKLKTSVNDLYKNGIKHYTANKFLAGGKLKEDKEAEIIKIIKKLED